MSQVNPTCPTCGAAASAGTKFCGECGAALQRVCQACGAPLSATTKFCGECGAAAAGGSAAPPSPAKPAKSGSSGRTGGARRKTQPSAEVAAANPPPDTATMAAAPPEQPTVPARKARSPAKAAPPAPPTERRPGGLKTIFLMMTNPGHILADRMSIVSWPFALLVSGAAFGLFFLQTGLDIARNNDQLLQSAGALTVIGVLYGTGGLVLIGIVAWLLTRLFGKKKSVGWTIRAFALSYSSALVYAAIGLPFNLLLGWNTSLAFGVTGVLWALGPMIAMFRELSGGSIGISIALATVCGSFVLWGWASLIA